MRGDFDEDEIPDLEPIEDAYLQMVELKQKYELQANKLRKDRDDWRSLAEGSDKAIDVGTRRISELMQEIASLHERLSESQMINGSIRDELTQQRLKVDALKRVLKSALKLPRPWMIGNGLTWPEWDGIMVEIEIALEEY